MREGRELGGALLTISARDVVMRWDMAIRQLIAVQVLRAAEFGIPSVRSSLMGWSTIVDASGNILALSRGERGHLLTWDRARGARRVDYQGREFAEGEPAPSGPEPGVAVLYSTMAPDLRTRCPEGACRWYPLESFSCPGQRAKTVIVAGHANPPTYLSQSPEQIADAVRCFSPELVVVDACFGASLPLASALSSALDHDDATFVSLAALVPQGGFHYLPTFFSDAPVAERAAAIKLPFRDDLTRWKVDRGELTTILAGVADMDAGQLNERLARRNPTEVKMPLSGGGSLLVPVAWERLRGARPRFQRRSAPP